MNTERFYVYEHIRKDTGAVFYVGKGSGKRCKHFVNRGKFWNNFCKSKDNVEVRLPIQNVDEEFSLLAEVELIDVYRRRGVFLVNISDGGEGTSGWIPSEETRKRIGKSNKHTPKASGEKHGMFGKKHTPESLAKMVESQNRRDHTNHPMRGKHHTEESKAKMSESLKGTKTGKDNPFFGKTHSAEVREKIRAVQLGRKQSPEQIQNRAKTIWKPVICLTNNQHYPSVTEASKILGIDASSISACCLGKLKTAGKMKFSYAEIER
jgi:hypothetical protein